MVERSDPTEPNTRGLAALDPGYPETLRNKN